MPEKAFSVCIKDSVFIDPASDRRSDIPDSHDTLYKRRKRLFRVCVAVLHPVLRNGIFRLVLR